MSPNVGINNGTFNSRPASVQLQNSAFQVTENIRTYKLSSLKKLDLSMLLYSFYDADTNAIVRNKITVYLRNSSSPYAIVDSAEGYLSSAGADSLVFYNKVYGVNYFIQFKHKNSIESWRKTQQIFSSNYFAYDFLSSAHRHLEII